MNEQNRDFKLGVAFAGGGVRGLSQIPVIDILQNGEITPDFVSGTSIGSIMATFCALGIPASEIKEICTATIQTLNENKAFSRPSPMFIVPTKNKLNGLVDGKIIEDLVSEVLEKYNIKNILDVRTPLVLVSVDIVTKKVVYFTNVWDFTPSRDAIVINDISLASAIRSSCSYPGILAANPVGDMLLSDGGLRMNLPVEPLYDLGADKVLSFTMTKGEDIKYTHSAIKTAVRSIDILFDELMTLQIRSSDLNIDLSVGNIPAFDFSKSDEVYEKGKEYAEENKEAILSFCKPYKEEPLPEPEETAEKSSNGFFRRLISRFKKEKKEEVTI